MGTLRLHPSVPLYEGLIRLTFEAFCNVHLGCAADWLAGDGCVGGSDPVDGAAAWTRRRRLHMLGRWLMVAGAAAIVVGLLAGCSQMNKGEVASSGDYSFMREAAHGNAAEVEMGRLTVQQAVDSDVKAFGQRMIDDHSSAQSRLMQLANRKNVDLPTEPAASQKMKKDSLAGKSGAAFDRAYMEEMVSDHEKDVQAYENQVNRGEDADVVAYARQTLPTLRDHLQRAREIEAKIGAD
jgi:putative membrane protein